MSLLWTTMTFRVVDKVPSLDRRQRQILLSVTFKSVKTQFLCTTNTMLTSLSIKPCVFWKKIAICYKIMFLCKAASMMNKARRPTEPAYTSQTPHGSELESLFYKKKAKEWRNKWDSKLYAIKPLKSILESLKVYESLKGDWTGQCSLCTTHTAYMCKYTLTAGWQLRISDACMRPARKFYNKLLIQTSAIMLTNSKPFTRMVYW